MAAKKKRKPAKAPVQAKTKPKPKSAAKSKAKSAAKSAAKGKAKRGGRAESKGTGNPNAGVSASDRQNDGAFGRWAPWLALGAIVVGIGLWQAFPGSAGPAVPENLTIRVVRSYPHDPEAFTQGLLFHEGALYESTGLYGESELRRVDPTSGEVAERVALDEDIFAEGLALAGSELIQITWRGGKAFVWDLESFERIREHDYRGEGWGICFDGERLIMSSGNDRLQFRDPVTFEKTGEVRVTRAGRRLRQLNELECVDGAVYANVWMDDHIARIDPETGQVTAWIDAGGLLPDEDRHGGEDVLNGIAHDPTTGHFFLTGKRWSRIFEVEFVPKE